MKVKVIIEKGLDGTYDARSEESKLNFLVIGQGNTVKEAKEDFIVCLNEIKEIYEEENKNFPVLEFEYVYDLPSFLQYFSIYFSYASLERITGVNQSQLSQYVQGYRKPSKKTAEKIEKNLHLFSEELRQVNFV